MSTSPSTHCSPSLTELDTPLPSDWPILGAGPDAPIDLLLVNAPLRDYSLRPRVNDFTLPVLGMGYLATYAASQGFTVGVLDGEALGLGIDRIQRIVNEAAPRWAGFNLLAPTYELSATIAAGLDPAIHIMVGGHQAKAMPETVIEDPRFQRLEALVVGEGETRVAELLDDRRRRAELPGVLWRDPVLGKPVTGGMPGKAWHLAPGTGHQRPALPRPPFLRCRPVPPEPWSVGGSDGGRSGMPLRLHLLRGGRQRQP
ncbi:cobalamin-dependent protein [Micromonospora sp. DT48]|uniref:cobalamin-dependent protein n=1 Tax=Micromonospora sp. DT48 TaxID=3393429 RepID=UPI003CF7E171